MFSLLRQKLYKKCEYMCCVTLVHAGEGNAAYGLSHYECHVTHFMRDARSVWRVTNASQELKYGFVQLPPIVRKWVGR